jgi:hypothetical protein
MIKVEKAFTAFEISTKEHSIKILNAISDSQSK